MKNIRLFEDWVFGKKSKNLVAFKERGCSVQDKCYVYYKIISMDDVDDDYDRYRVGNKIIHLSRENDIMDVRYYGIGDWFVVINFSRDGVVSKKYPYITDKGEKTMKKYIQKHD